MNAAHRVRRRSATSPTATSRPRSGATAARRQRDLVHERDELPRHLRRLAQHAAQARAPERARHRRQGDQDSTRSSDDPREQPVTAGQLYHFKIERTDGKTVRWSVNGTRVPHVRRRGAARGRGPRPLRLQRLGSEGLLRQREGHAAPLSTTPVAHLVRGRARCRLGGAWSSPRSSRGGGAGVARSTGSGRSTISTSWASSVWSRSFRARTSSAGSRSSARSRSATRACASAST